MKKIILAGNAITAEILYGYLARDDRYEVVGLTVDDEYVDKGSLRGFESTAVSRLREAYPPGEYSVIMAMGYNKVNRSRESFFTRLKDMDYHIETYVHPDAGVYSELPLGEGSVVLPSAVVEPHAKVGANTLVWCNVTLAHHSSVADHCWIASGAVVSGQANVERNVFVGVNATIVNKVVIGEYSIIGGGALITKNTKAASVHLARSGEEVRFSSDDYDKYFGI